MTVFAMKYGSTEPISSFVYLHGLLDELNKCDFCKVDGLDYPPKEEDYGIHDVTVVLENVTCPGKLFLWKRRSSWAGLVVSADDPEYLADAQKKFDRREEDI